MNIGIILAIAAFLVLVLYLRKKKSKPEPKKLVVASPATTPPLQKLQTAASKVPPASKEPVQRRHAVASRISRPQRTIITKQGTVYIPLNNGTYRNGSDNTIITYLMLYTLLSDDNKNLFEHPEGYIEGMTYHEASDISRAELKERMSDTGSSVAILNIGDDHVRQMETEARNLADSQVSVTETEQPSAPAPVETNAAPSNDSPPQSFNNDTNTTYTSDTNL